MYTCHACIALIIGSSAHMLYMIACLTAFRALDCNSNSPHTTSVLCPSLAIPSRLLSIKSGPSVCRDAFSSFVHVIRRGPGNSTSGRYLLSIYSVPYRDNASPPRSVGTFTAYNSRTSRISSPQVLSSPTNETKITLKSLIPRGSLFIYWLRKSYIFPQPTLLPKCTITSF